MKFLNTEYVTAILKNEIDKLTKDMIQLDNTLVQLTDDRDEVRAKLNQLVEAIKILSQEPS